MQPRPYVHPHPPSNSSSPCLSHSPLPDAARTPSQAPWFPGVSSQGTSGRASWTRRSVPPPRGRRRRGRAAGRGRARTGWRISISTWSSWTWREREGKSRARAFASRGDRWVFFSFSSRGDRWVVFFLPHLFVFLPYPPCETGSVALVWHLMLPTSAPPPTPPTLLRSQSSQLHRCLG
jgi:hypothetical protein